MDKGLQTTAERIHTRLPLRLDPQDATGSWHSSKSRKREVWGHNWHLLAGQQVLFPLRLLNNKCGSGTKNSAMKRIDEVPWWVSLTGYPFFPPMGLRDLKESFTKHKHHIFCLWSPYGLGHKPPNCLQNDVWLTAFRVTGVCSKYSFENEHRISW